MTWAIFVPSRGADGIGRFVGFTTVAGVDAATLSAPIAITPFADFVILGSSRVGAMSLMPGRSSSLTSSTAIAFNPAGVSSTSPCTGSGFVLYLPSESGGQESLGGLLDRGAFEAFRRRKTMIAALRGRAQ